MIVKIQDFNNNQFITDPLNTEAELFSVSITNINSEHIQFLPIVDEFDVKQVIIEYEDSFVIDDLLLSVDVSKGARYEINLTSNKIVVYAESNTHSASWNIIWTPVESITTILVSKVLQNDEPITNFRNFGNNGIAIAYMNWIDNDTTTYYDIDVKTNFNDTTFYDLISFDGTDPDSEDTFGATVDVFSTDEKTFLDSNYLYLRVVRSGSDNVYIELRKSLTQDTSSDLEDLRNELSNKWIDIYLGSIAILSSDDSALVIQASKLTSVQALKDYFFSANIKYWDLKSYLLTLIDNISTDQYYVQQKSFADLSNNIEYNDLMSYGIQYAGKAFSNLIHDELELVTSVVIKPEIIQYLRTIYDTDYKASLCSETYNNIQFVYFKYAGVNELTLLSTRLLKHIQENLLIVRYNQQNNLIIYNISTSDIEKCIQIITTIYEMKTNYQFTQLSINNGSTFFTKLEQIVKNESIPSLTL